MEFTEVNETERTYIFPNDQKVTFKEVLRYCFKRAGWKTCGKTKGGLWILEKGNMCNLSKEREK